MVGGMRAKNGLVLMCDERWVDPSGLKKFLNISGPRKRAGFNVAQYDVLYGKKTSKPCAMDFLTPQGFVSGSKFVLICIHACMDMANAC